MYGKTLSQQGPINVERARSMARSMTSPIHIFGLVHAMQMKIPPFDSVKQYLLIPIDSFNQI